MFAKMPSGRADGSDGRDIVGLPSVRARPGRALLVRAAPDGIPGARTLIRRGLTGLFGQPPIDPEIDRGDPGLTGPTSSSWQVLSEPAAIAGGIRGLLLQVAHPAAMAGVHDHSAFRQDPLGRLQRTSSYVVTTTFGSASEALRAIRIVRSVHRKVTGTDPEGRPYRADDPHLLAWVSLALTSSFLVADRLWSPSPVTGAAADRFVNEQSRISGLLDPRVDLEPFERDESARDQLRAGRAPLPMIDEGRLPTTVAGLSQLLADFTGELRIDHQAREAISFLRDPPLDRVARSGYRVLLGGAIASLSTEQRRTLDIDLTRSARSAMLAQATLGLTAMRIGTGISLTSRLAHRRLGSPRSAG